MQFHIDDTIEKFIHRFFIEITAYVYKYLWSLLLLTCTVYNDNFFIVTKFPFIQNRLFFFPFFSLKEKTIEIASEAS